MEKQRTILFYDGTCGFCHGVVGFCNKKLKDENVFFAPLQGKLLAEMRKKDNKVPTSNEAIILQKNGVYFEGPKAFYELAKGFKQPFKLISFLSFLPNFVSQFFYNLIAKKRHSIFGKKEACEIPNKKFMKRFIMD